MTPYPSTNQSVDTMTLKDTPGQLMNILLTFSPKIPTFRKQIKIYKEKDVVCSLVLSLSLSLCLSLSSMPMLFSIPFFPWVPSHPLPRVSQGTPPPIPLSSFHTPTSSLLPFFPQTHYLCFLFLSGEGPPFASVTCFLSTCSPAGFLLLWLTYCTSVTFEISFHLYLSSWL